MITQSIFFHFFFWNDARLDIKYIFKKKITKLEITSLIQNFDNLITKQQSSYHIPQLLI